RRHSWTRPHPSCRHCRSSGRSRPTSPPPSVARPSATASRPRRATPSFVSASRRRSGRRLIRRSRRRRNRPDMATRHRVVISGGGLGGLRAAHARRPAPVDVTLIDRRNYHLFQPLLYQVATGSLSPGQIAAPIRSVLSRQKNTRVLMGDVVDIDPAAKRVMLADGAAFEYDSLIVAAGSQTSYYG